MGFSVHLNVQLKFYNLPNKMSFQGPHYPNGSNKGLDRMEDYNSKRDWKKVKIIQTKKESF